jgi:hypothetical protein
MKTETSKSEQKESARIARILAGLPATERDNLVATLEKYRAGKAALWETHKLVACGLIEIPKADGFGNLASCMTIKAMAAQLTRHFRGRIAIERCSPLLCQWRKGRGLPPGTPLPPSKDGNHHLAGKWAEWIEKYILPKHGVGAAATDSPSVFQQAEEAKARGQIDRAACASIERNVMEGAYTAREQHRAVMVQIGQILNNAITRYVEKQMADTITDAAARLHLIADETKMADFAASIRQLCENAADALRAALAQELREDAEKAQDNPKN